MKLKVLFCAYTAFVIAALSAGELADAILAKMTLEEKVALMAGNGTITLRAIPRVGITNEFAFSDNSQSVRRDMQRWSYNYTAETKVGVVLQDDVDGSLCQATVLPTLSALASTWNKDLAAEHGEELGSEMRGRGKDMVLGPGINLMRTPLCGRNWEYMTEDPYLCAKLAVPLVKGIQKYDVAACVKHFACNDQELNRFQVITWVDERTLREIYLPAFEACVKEGGALAMMSAYDRFRGTYCAENDYLQNQILRNEWGFTGVTVTDWGALHNTVMGALGGEDIEMCDGKNIVHYANAKALADAGVDEQFARGEKPVVARGLMPLRDAVLDGYVPEWVVTMRVREILNMMEAIGFLGNRPRAKGEVNTPEHQALGRRIGEEAVTLLKNEKRELPLEAANLKRVLVIGKLADTCHCKGGWSAEGNPPYEITPYEGLKERLGAKVEIVKSPLVGTTNAPVDFAALKVEAEKADAILVFTGTTTGHGRALECEGADRPNMLLPEGDDEAIARILSWKLPRTIVINHSGAPVEMPWVDNCTTLVQQPYLGQEAGRALAAVLMGDVNPSGKLPCTWPRRYADTPTAIVGTYNPSNIVYNEGIFMGYRWYDKKGIAPMFPFGYGLSYSTFSYGKAQVTVDKTGWTVTVPVTNMGPRAGAEIVQLYVSAPESPVVRCVKELKGFTKLPLAAGQMGTASFHLTARDLAYFDVPTHRFVSVPGRYTVLIGASSADIRTTCTFDYDKTESFLP